MSVNSFVVIGDSRLDYIHHFTAKFEVTPLDNTSNFGPSYSFQLKTKYYCNDIDLYHISEIHLVNYLIDPISTQSQQLVQLLNSANCVMVLFDITQPENAGFKFITELYKPTLHKLLTSVDTHIFAGCSEKSSQNGDDIYTVPNVTTANWSRWQNFALDFNMQLLILDQVLFLENGNRSENMDQSLDKSQLYDQINNIIMNSDNITKDDDIGNNNDDIIDIIDDIDDDENSNDLIELDSSEIGINAVISAISCCSWPKITRNEPKSSKSSKSSQLETTSSHQLDDPTTIRHDNNSPPIESTSNDKFQAYLPPTQHTFTKTKTSNQNNKQPQNEKNKNKNSSKSKQDPMAALDAFENLFSEAAQFASRVQTGRINDTQRRERATLFTLRLAQQFSLFGDDDDGDDDQHESSSQQLENIPNQDDLLPPWADFNRDILFQDDTLIDEYTSLDDLCNFEGAN
jgi:hypothetical protein